MKKALVRLNGLNCANDGEFFLILYIYIKKIKRHWLHVIYDKERFLLNGSGSRDKYFFWKPINDISTFCISVFMRIRVLNFYPALFKRKINMLFEFASLKTLNNSTNWSESRIKILYPHLFPLVGRFSPVYNYIHGRLSEQLLEVAVGKKAGTSSLKKGYCKDFRSIFIHVE